MMIAKISFTKIIVFVVHIYRLVTGQCQTLIVRRSAHFQL